MWSASMSNTGFKKYIPETQPYHETIYKLKQDKSVRILWSELILSEDSEINRETEMGTETEVKLIDKKVRQNRRHKDGHVGIPL